MQNDAYELPDWINEFALGDDLFARAYDAVPDHRRALLKTGIARLWEWYGPSRARARRKAVSWRAGFSSVEESAPADCAVVAFNGDLVSPARLLAAVVPAVTCGVDTVLPVRLGGDAWPEPVLAGLELAGLERVVQMEPHRLKTLLEETDRAGRTCVAIGLELGPGVFRSLRFPTRNIDFTCLKCDREAALWMDADDPFDLDALAFAHPDLSVSVHDGDGDFGVFLNAIRDIAYVPPSRVGQALTRARLVLGPGQEGCWVWPQLRPEAFLFHSTAWTIGA